MDLPLESWFSCRLLSYSYIHKVNPGKSSFVSRDFSCEDEMKEERKEREELETNFPRAYKL
jgi:hypothetical protein